MNEKRIFALLDQLWRDLHAPDFIWQVLALLMVLAVSWGLSYRLRKGGDNHSEAVEPQSALRKFGTGSLKRIAFPLIALVLVLLVRKVLAALQWEHLSLLYLAGPLLVSLALARMFAYVLRRVLPAGMFLTHFERVITTVIWFGVILHLTGLADPLIEALEQISFPVGKQKIDLWMLIHGTVTVGVTLLVALWIASLIESRLMATERMDGNLREVMARLAKAVLAVIALLCSLSLVGIDVTALSVFSGAFAVGLGLGLQKIASNYVSGFIILLDRSIRLGNLVAVDATTTGTVSQITTRYTVLKTLTGTEVIIPNEYLVSNIVRNLSFSDTRVRVAVSVQVAYQTDLDQAMQIMVDAARRQERVLADPPPGVQLTDFAESGINLELGFWVSDPEAGTGGVRSEINLSIWKAFCASGIEIPYPQREVRVIGSPAVAA
ncbi:MAG: mechanosensitive ion channel [Propionivibrio sp.]